MNSFENDNIDDIAQLKSLAISLNEELKHLHSKQLFSNFKGNQIDFLLEDLKNGRFDDDKLKIQKRVEWHILNSVTQKSENVNSDISETKLNGNIKNKDEILVPTAVRGKKSSIRSCKDAKQTNLLSSRRENHSFIASSQKRPIIRERKYCLKSNESIEEKKVKKIDKAAPRDFTNVPNLKMVFNPCINIPPLSRNSLPSVNIKSERKISQNSKDFGSSIRKQKYVQEKSSILRPTLQKVTNAPVHVMPLSEQKMPSIMLLPDKKFINTSTNQAFITCKYSQLSPENADTSFELTSSHNLEREGPSTEFSFRSPRRTVREKIVSDDHTDEEPDSSPLMSDDFVDAHLSRNAFDSKRFIDRLEERLSAVLISLPNTKFSENKVTKSHLSDLPVSFTNHDAFSNSELDSLLKSISKQNSFEAQTTSDQCSSKSLNNNLKILQPLKFNDASSQAGSSYIKKFSKDEFVQTNLPEKQSPRDDYNSSFENEESIKKDEKLSEEIEAELSSEDDAKNERLSTSSRVSSEGTRDATRDQPDDENILNVNDSSIQKHSSELSGGNGENDEQNDVTDHNIVSFEKESISSHELQNTEEAPSQSNEESETSGKSVSLREGSKPEIEVVEQKNDEKNQVVPKVNTVIEPPLSANDEREIFNNSDVQNNGLIISENSRSDNSKSKELDSPESSKNAKESSKNSNDSTRISTLESAPDEETILPSIEIGDVTISDGEIEFEASISDIHPCNRIAIKFSTKDFGISANHSNHSLASVHSAHKETQTAVSNPNTDIVYDSSISEGVLQLQSEKETALSDVSEENEETTINFSEGELLGKESPPPPKIFLDDQERESLQRENEILRDRLAAFTGRFCLN